MKNESLLVSLLKQEALTEKKIDLSFNRTTNRKYHDDEDDEETIYDSSHVQVKLEKKDPDFVVKKPKGSKKSSTKSQVCRTNLSRSNIFSHFSHSQ